jgi:predicted site-specific integrase-resolvase
MVGNVLKVERKFAWDVAFGMDWRRAAYHLEREGGLALKAAIYARVSTSNGSQTCENQLLELRRYCDARGWIV